MIDNKFYYKHSNRF